VRLTREFAVAPERVSSYEHSYHGLARRIGSNVAADCASCHGAHDVLPSSDPRSAVHSANLTKTCGKCHEGVKDNFARGTIHIGGGGGGGGRAGGGGSVSDKPSVAIDWIRSIYLVLIVGTIGGMLLHNLIIWIHKARLARKAPDRTIMRMNLNQRIQHAVLVVSFTVLVISGFALSWPDSIFAAPFGPSEETRRVVHRLAAIVMIAIGIYHMAYMTFTREGRQGLRDLWFRLTDAKDVIGVLRYYLGRSSTKPEFARFSYAEKAEYWAGLWGTVVMALTGLVMWYSVTVATWVPRWWVDIATTIHFYEAILATLAIVVWHLYHVIFDPDVYPMNWAWFDGKMSEHQYREEHGLEAKKTIAKETERGA
jgi:cytochrome b subunit of formate dehydrogenase